MQPFELAGDPLYRPTPSLPTPLATVIAAAALPAGPGSAAAAQQQAGTGTRPKPLPEADARAALAGLIADASRRSAEAAAARQAPAAQPGPLSARSAHD